MILVLVEESDLPEGSTSEKHTKEWYRNKNHVLQNYFKERQIRDFMIEDLEIGLDIITSNDK